MATRRDYVAAAHTLRTVRKTYAPHWDPNLFRACDDHAAAFAALFKMQNKAFDVQRFLADCGYGLKELPE